MIKKYIIINNEIYFLIFYKVKFLIFLASELGVVLLIICRFKIFILSFPRIILIETF